MAFANNSNEIILGDYAFEPKWVEKVAVESINFDIIPCDWRYLASGMNTRTLSTRKCC